MNTNIDEIYENIISLVTNENMFSLNLYNDIANIIWKYTEKSRTQMQDNNTDEITQNIIQLGEKILSEAIKKEDLKRLLIAYCIFDFCNYNKDFIYIIKNVNLIKKLEKAYNSFTLKIDVPKDAPYNEKKLLEILNDAEKNRNIKQRFEVMETLRNHSATFYKIDKSMVLFIRLLWTCDKTIILDDIETKDTITVEFILYALEELLEDFLKIEFSDCYIQLRIASLLAYHLQEKYIPPRSEDFSKLPDYSDYYRNLFSKNKTEIFKNSSCFHFLHLTGFSFLFGIACAKEISLSDIYISFTNFTFVETTKAFSSGFMKANKKKENLLILGEKLLSKLKATEIKSYSDFNSYFGIFDILINYYFAIGLSRTEYLEKLKNQSNEIYLIQNSWDYSNLTSCWFSLWFQILSNKIYKYSFDEDEIKDAIPILFDKRNYLALGDKGTVFSNMINILENPEKENEIIVMLNNKEFKISLNDNEE